MFRTMLLIMFDLCSCCNMYRVLFFVSNFLFLFVSYSCSFCYYTACCCWCCCRQCCCLCILCLQSKTTAMFVYIAGLQWFHLPHSLDAICTLLPSMNIDSLQSPISIKSTSKLWYGMSPWFSTWMIDTCMALVAVVLHLAADEKAGLMLLKANEKGKAWSMGLHWTLFCGDTRMLQE